MGRFEELGKKLDKLAEQIKATTQTGIEKTATEAKEWRDYLDDLAEKIKKTSYEGLEKFAAETKELGRVAKLRSQIRDKKRELQDKFQRMGELSFKLKVYEKVEEEEFKKLGEEISNLEKEIKEKEKEIQKLKSS